MGALALVALATVARWFRDRSAPSVETVAVRVEEVVEPVRGPGVVDARVIASVGSRITGIFAGVLANVGDRVEAGASLARLDDSQLRARLAATGAAAAEREVDYAVSLVPFAGIVTSRRVSSGDAVFSNQPRWPSVRPRQRRPLSESFSA